MTHRNASSPRLKVAKTCEGPSRTKQSFKEECQIDNIIAKYHKTGVCDHLARTKGQYGDFIKHSDYRTNCDRIIEANDMFDRLPSNVRKRFSNDAVEFLNFVQDDNNVEEMISLGLAHPREKAVAAKQETAKKESAEKQTQTEKTT